MRNKIILLLSIFIIISLAGAAIVLFSNSISEKHAGDGKESETAAISESQPEANGTGEGLPNTQRTNIDSSTGQSTVDKGAEIVKNEEIPVINNSLEYDMKVFLYENGLGQTFLKFEYYKDGIDTVKELDDVQIPELKDIFTNREQMQKGESGFNVKDLFLNTKMSKVYFMVNGKTYEKDIESTLYSFDLSNSGVIRLFSSKGMFSGAMFTKDMSYMAFSCAVTGDKENSFLQVVKCDTDELIVNRNMDLEGILIGSNKDTTMSYDYSLLSWYTAKILKLKEMIRLKDQTALGSEDDQSTEVLYDVEGNSFVNADGSPITSSRSAQHGDGKNRTESEPVKALIAFYTYISSDTEYVKAYEMLDDNFVAKLGLLTQFDIDELKKSDMDLDSFPLYATLFKAAKVGSIVSEKTSEGITIIYYYQILAVEGSDEVIKQPMVIRIKKVGNSQKILGIVDGNAEEVPFK